MEQGSIYNHQFLSSQVNLDLPKDGFDELEDLVKSLEIDISKQCNNVNDLDFLTIFENEGEDNTFQKNASNCQIKSSKKFNEKKPFGRILDSKEDFTTSSKIVSDNSSTHNTNSPCKNQLNTSDNFLGPPTTGTEHEVSKETSSLDYVSSQFESSVLSENINEGPLVLIPLTLFKEICSTHDSCLSDHNYHQDLQHETSIQTDNLAVKKQGSIQKICQEVAVQKKVIRKLNQQMSTKARNKLSSGHITKNARNLVKKDFSFSCRICGDDAAKYSNYGGKSCFSCRIFFKRAVEHSQR